jgi:hypothetical protein
MARENSARVRSISRPNYLIGTAVLLIVLLSPGMLAFSVSRMDFGIGRLTITEFVQVTEAAINDVILMGAALFFLFTLENRIKRSRAVNALHELRSVVHVIDMHQLTKDPGRVLDNANELESLVTGLSRKIWQKVMIVHKLDGDGPI